MTRRSDNDPMVIFGPGQCTECGGQLTVIDMETVFMNLSPSGSPVSEDTMINCEAVCSHCGKRIPMMRNGLDYMPDNGYNRFMRYYKLSEFNKAKKAEIDKLRPTEDNPFCINLERQS